jgi:hypothetical protein
MEGAGAARRQLKQTKNPASPRRCFSLLLQTRGAEADPSRPQVLPLRHHATLMPRPSEAIARADNPRVSPWRQDTCSAALGKSSSPSLTVLRPSQRTRTSAVARAPVSCEAEAAIACDDHMSLSRQSGAPRLAVACRRAPGRQAPLAVALSAERGTDLGLGEMTELEHTRQRLAGRSCASPVHKHAALADGRGADRPGSRLRPTAALPGVAADKPFARPDAADLATALGDAAIARIAGRALRHKG